MKQWVQGLTNSKQLAALRTFLFPAFVRAIDSPWEPLLVLCACLTPAHLYQTGAMILFFKLFLYYSPAHFADLETEALRREGACLGAHKRLCENSV